ncbi:MAG TPA: response regulator, partial [Elusimicrobiota bacterium]|nr:response regulator [Elusimicrobiota bacterium]
MAYTILVVDDDLTIVQLLKAHLEEEGYVVLAGFDGQMALQLAQTRKPNLIVMDVNMPMTSGV